MRRIAGLKALVGEYDALICDVWGVLHNGVRAFPGAAEAIGRFRVEAGPVVLLTNAPRPAYVVQEQLGLLGVPDDAYDAIVTSGDVTRGFIAGRPGARVHHIGPERDLAIYDGLDVSLVGEAEADVICCTGPFDDTRETPEDYRDRFAGLVARKLAMICANPDFVVDRGGHLIYCAGALARLYEEMGGDTVLVGKPHAPVYEVAQAEVGKRGGSRVLAVGDGLPTDIRGAAMNGLPALFVTGGIHAADFGDHAAPDGERVAARLRAEDLDAVAYIPSLVWGSEAAS